MSWKHVILISCILGVAFVAVCISLVVVKNNWYLTLFILKLQSSTVTPEEVQEKLATFANIVKEGKLQYTVGVPIYWLTCLQTAELVKSNLSNEFVSYSNSFDDFINITSLGTTGACWY